MSYDKQLRGLALQDILEKRRLDQALNAKEFSLAAGISYSTAREWFRHPGFPVIKGFVFWGDFVQWRRDQTTVAQHEASSTQETKSSDSPVSTKAGCNFRGEQLKFCAKPVECKRRLKSAAGLMCDAADASAE